MSGGPCSLDGSVDTPAIQIQGIKKRFGKVEALRGIDLEVRPSTVLGLLGPNGAGKTTAVRILTTLLHPDEGKATVLGMDVVEDAEQLRHEIGLAGQNAAVDENLTGHENLVMVGRLYHLSAAEAKRRAEEVLERFELTDAGHRTAKTYSGGMRRRLDLGASLVGRPQVLFLDEPTTGLDPKGRLEMWDVIRELVSDGTTLLLTTQYLEEADSLADTIAVIDGGKVIAEGTSDELKDRVGGEVLAIAVADRADLEKTAAALQGLGSGSPKTDDAGGVTLPVGTDATSVLTEAVRRLDDAGIKLADIALHRPSLDDVFLALTGHAAEETADGDQDEGKKKRRGRKRT
jgi:ABC-2 type transport system ATP-binding protein